jgi:hypothetical protein
MNILTVAEFREMTGKLVARYGKRASYGLGIQGKSIVIEMSKTGL